MNTKLSIKKFFSPFLLLHSEGASFTLVLVKKHFLEFILVREELLRKRRETQELMKMAR